MNAQTIMPRMPLNVKIFLWLTLAVVFYWLATNAWFWLHPPTTYAPSVEKLIARSPKVRELLDHGRRNQGYVWTGATLVWSVVSLSLAWMVAFHRLNWARWTYAFVFVFRRSIPLIVALFSEPDMCRYLLHSYWNEGWMNPRHYIDPGFFIAAIVFVFTGGSRNWFRRAQPV
jgi:hypothetical protein